MPHAGLMAVAHGDGDLAHEGQRFGGIDRLALALLLDVGERATLDPFVDDDEVFRRVRRSVAHEGGAIEDVEDGDKSALVDGGGSTGGNGDGRRARVIGGQQEQGHRAVEGGIVGAPDLHVAA